MLCKDKDFVRSNIRGHLEDIYFDYIFTNSSEEKFRKEIFDIGYVNYAAATREKMFYELSQKEQLRTDRIIGQGRNRSTYQNDTSRFDEIQDMLLMIFAKYLNPDIFIITGESSRILLSENFALAAYKSVKVRNYMYENNLSKKDLSDFYKTILRVDEKSLFSKYTRLCVKKDFKMASEQKLIPHIEYNENTVVEMIRKDAESTFGINLADTRILEVFRRTGIILNTLANFYKDFTRLGIVPKNKSSLFKYGLSSMAEVINESLEYAS